MACGNIYREKRLEKEEQKKKDAPLKFPEDAPLKLPEVVPIKDQPQRKHFRNFQYQSNTQHLDEIEHLKLRIEELEKLIKENK